MSIKILIDMNLSPDWVPLLQDAGWQARHWAANVPPTTGVSQKLAVNEDYACGF
jgi:hypothetical protein